MKYTDKDLIRASQIAYFDIDYQVINDINDYVKDNPAFKPNYTLSELYEHSSTFKDNIYDDISKAAYAKRI